jgi:DNA topoisomerase-3
MPNEIDNKYTFWSLNNLPFRFDDIPLKVSESVSEQYEIVNKLMHDDRVEEIINACDSDREGDLIFRNLYKYSHPTGKKVTRMWLESQTEEGILESFNTRKLEKEYNNVYFAGKARSYADYIIGLNSTRAMTCKFGGKDNVLTVGRVQTPTLRILVDTEKEINDFHPQKFYKIQAEGVVNDSDIVGNYTNEDLDQNRFMNKEDALKVIEKIGLGEASIIEASQTERKEKPKMLYSLSDLQVDMDKRYHMSPLDVLNTVQSLYETHKLVTYPRTDETHISKELAQKSLSIVKSLACKEDIKQLIE